GASASEPVPGRPGQTARPTPTRTADPTPTRTAEQPPTPPVQPPSGDPSPTVAEPSSSAHEETGPQLVQREPAPQAGVPV
ncbi:hypothetical protein GTY92_06605, partial [Streptomyces sp. SID4950]|nr:hypothetical protein [Streptomyces sp. SID4950]